MTQASDELQPNAPQRIETEPWFSDGLCFECTQCGNCCTGPPGYVWFTTAEGRAMAQTLGVDEAEFRARYGRRVYGRWSLREQVTAHGHDCIFLDRQTQPGKALCRVYGARPAQCRSWPFWPENLKSKRAWITVKNVTPCPGMDSGKLYRPDEIRIIRDGAARRGGS